MNSGIAKVVGSAGLVYGLYYGMKKGGTKNIVIYAAIFGVAGLVVGGAISKFYEY